MNSNPSPYTSCKVEDEIDLKQNVIYKFKLLSIMIAFDWNLCGYCLFLLGSTIYLVQALIPYYKNSSSSTADFNKLNSSSSNITNGITYYYYGSNPPLYPKNVSGWESVAAGIIFVIDSMMYLIGWVLSAIENEEKSSVSWWIDLNLHGNIFYIILSIGYLITAVFQLQNKYGHVCTIVNLIIAVLFVVDSLFYLFALFQGSTSRTSSKYNDISNKQNKDMEDNLLNNIKNKRRLDYYLVASLLFVFGSIIYVIASIQQYYGITSDLMNLIGAIIFMIDSLFYILSAFQFRSDDLEVPFIHRNNIFLISIANKDYILV